MRVVLLSLSGDQSYARVPLDETLEAREGVPGNRPGEKARSPLMKRL